MSAAGSLADVAMQYSELGLAVFPLHSVSDAGQCTCGRADCRSAGKHPRTPTGVNDATTDAATVRQWWLQWTDANIGIATGASSGIVVVDVDAKTGGPRSLATLEEQHGEIPATCRANTGGGGFHLYFSHPGFSVRNSVGRIGAGIDVRGDGGYVVAPPSRHHSGAKYEWAAASGPGEAELSSVPAWLLEAMTADTPLGQKAREVPTKILEGSRREIMLSLAGTMRRRGMGGDEILGALRKVNSRCVDAQDNPLPLPDDELTDLAADVESRYDPSDDPAELAASIDAARRAVANLVEEVGSDAGVLVELENLDALALLREKAKPDWLRLRHALKEGGAPLRELDRALKDRQRTTANAAQSAAPHPYSISGGVMMWHRPTPEGPVPTPLSNFTARIVGEETRDNGAERTTVFRISGKTREGAVLPEAEVPSAAFGQLGWVAANWGTRAVVNAGFSTRDHLRAAIQILSGSVPRKTLFGHLGWRRIGSQWVYLHGGGAIGPDGPVAGVEVSLGDGRLAEYRLPGPPASAELRDALQESLSFLELAPAEITYPLLAATYRAPLAEICPCDFSVSVVGQTGVQKSELTGLVQAHYGAGFNGKCLPGNWNSTANALEKLSFLTKDAVLVVDDFAPTGTNYDVQRLHREADRLLRGQGNRAGRERMWADGTLRPEYFSRGLIVTSGEDLPRGQSLRARCIFLEVNRGDVDLARLTELQAASASGQLAAAMAGFIRWRGGRLEEMKPALQQRHQELRASARQAGLAHDRTPDHIASLYLGLEQFLAYATEAGAIDESEQRDRSQVGWQALTRAAASQTLHQSASNPAERFIQLVVAAVSSGRAHVAGRDGGPPLQAHSLFTVADPTPLGWVLRGSEADGEWSPRGERIGWLSGDDLYLEPDASFDVVRRMVGDSGDGLTVTRETLRKRLHEAGYLVTIEEDRGLVVRKTFQGARVRVLHLSASHILARESAQPTQPAQVTVLGRAN